MHGARKKDDGDGDGIISLVRETADGLGHLISDHIKLARLELVSDAKSYGRQSALLLVMGALLILGYALAAVGLALVLSQWWGAITGFFAVAGLHVVVGGIGLAVAISRMRRTHLMDETLSEVSRSVSTLRGHVANGSGLRAAEHRTEASRV